MFDGEYIYDAFISYRHQGLDQKIAKKMHKRLETYKIPRGIRKKYGLKPLKKVFIDKKELTASDDLTGSINEALIKSRYLIVVCSPDTPLSKYVTQEIETFVNLGRSDRIIAVLIKGSKETSFMDALKKIDATSGLSIIDIRSTSNRKIMNLFSAKISNIYGRILNIDSNILKHLHFKFVLQIIFVIFFIFLVDLMYYIGTNLISDYVYEDNDRTRAFISLTRNAYRNYYVLFSSSPEALDAGLTLTDKKINSYAKLKDDAINDTFEEENYPEGYKRDIYDLYIDLVENYVDKGNLYLLKNKFDYAATYYKLAFQYVKFSSLFKSSGETNEIDFISDFTNVLCKLGYSLLLQGKFSEAKDCYEAIITEGEKIITAFPEGHSLHVDIRQSIMPNVGEAFFRLSEICNNNKDTVTYQTAYKKATFYLSEAEQENTKYIKYCNKFSINNYKVLESITSNCKNLRECYLHNSEYDSLKNTLPFEIDVREKMLTIYDDCNNMVDLANCYYLMGYIQGRDNSLSEMDKYYGQEYELRSKIMGLEKNKVLIPASDRAINILRVANLSENQNFTKVVSLYTEGLELGRDSLLNPRLVVGDYTKIYQLINFTDGLCALLIRNGKFDEAVEQCEQNVNWLTKIKNGNIEAKNASTDSYVIKLMIRTYLTMFSTKGREGKYLQAATYVDNGIALCEDLAKSNDQEANKIMASLYSASSLIKLFTKDFLHAVELAHKAVLLDSSNIMYQKNLAHAYLLSGQGQIAEEIYLKYRNTVFNDGRSFAQTVLDEFAEFRTHNINSPELHRIEKIIKAN